MHRVERRYAELLEKEVQNLKEEIAAIRNEKNDITLKKYVETENIKVDYGPQLKKRKVLRGHEGKIYAMQWSTTDPVYLLSAGQDGKLIVWDGMTTYKKHAVSITSWVMGCSCSPSNIFVAAGGLDSMCSIYNLSSPVQPIKACMELGHKGYVSCCRFVTNNQILTGSGDKLCVLWDIERGIEVKQYEGHSGEITSLSLSPDINTFITGAVDQSVKLWDLRSSSCCQTFTGHSGDINAVQFLSTGNAFGTGSDDSTARLWDIRADRELMQYHTEHVVSSATCVAFSISGRYFFVGYDDSLIRVWDTLRGELIWPIQHDFRVSCLGLNLDGTALCSASWDQRMIIWA